MEGRWLPRDKGPSDDSSCLADTGGSSLDSTNGRGITLHLSQQRLWIYCVGTFLNIFLQLHEMLG